MLMSMAVYSLTGTKLLPALVVSTACLWSVGTVASGLLSQNDVSIYRSAIAASESGHWTLAHRTAAEAKAPLPAKILTWMDMTRRGTDITFGQISRMTPDESIKKVVRTIPINSRPMNFFNCHTP